VQDRGEPALVPQADPLPAFDELIAVGAHAGSIDSLIDRCTGVDATLGLQPARVAVLIEILDRCTRLGPALLGATGGTESRQQDERQAQTAAGHVASYPEVTDEAAHRRRVLGLCAPSRAAAPPRARRAHRPPRDPP